MEFLEQFDAKNGFFDSFLWKNVYNYVLSLNGSKVTALNVCQILNVSHGLKINCLLYRLMNVNNN